MVEKENSVVVQLGMTPCYLDPHCHEALYEVDVGVKELCDRPEGAVASREGARDRQLAASRTRGSQEASIVHE